MFDTVRTAEGLIGDPVDSSALTIYGKKTMTKALQDRLMTHDELGDFPVKLIQKLASDMAEESLEVASQIVFESRKYNNEIVHYRRSIHSEGPKWIGTGRFNS